MPEIFSKIETKIGIFNSKKILEVSNVMLARGDLLMNCNLTNFIIWRKNSLNVGKVKVRIKLHLQLACLSQ